MYFDSHTHVNFQAFKTDWKETIDRALANETWMINVGTQLGTSGFAAGLAKNFPQGVFASIGLHPIHTWQQLLDEEESHFKTREEEFDGRAYEKLINEKVVAVGECGLDYFRLPKEFQEQAKLKQKAAFIAQIAFAKKHKLALIVHCRDAYEDVLEILKAEYSGLPGVIHSFTDSWETAKKFVDFGFHVAFNGILTFDKSGRLAEAVKNMPLDRILAETDAPYLTPPPYRGKRNEPVYVRYVVDKIAQIRSLAPLEMADQTFKNACELFQIKKTVV